MRITTDSGPTYSPRPIDRLADIGGMLVGAFALAFALCWYLAHLLG